MLKASDAGILFRAPVAVREEFPDFAAVEDYEALQDLIQRCGET